jgi:AcrR family transcriptional regulator
MPRIAERRPGAVPVTDGQQGRRASILKAAVRLGKAKEIDRISAQEIAGEAGVALRTLYRYYPSKHHVFAAVLTQRVEALDPPVRKPRDVGEAVADLMAEACQDMLRHKHLAHAMITSTQAVRAQSGPAGYHAMRDIILATAGIENPTDDQIRVARLVEQATFGVLTWTVGGELDPEQAIADIRLACRLLLAPVSTH